MQEPTSEQLVYDLVTRAIAGHGRVYTMGLLMGMIIRLARNDAALKRELKKRIQDLKSSK